MGSEPQPRSSSNKAQTPKLRQRGVCGPLLPLRTKQQGTARSCQEEDACGLQLISSSSRKRTPKLCQRRVCGHRGGLRPAQAPAPQREQLTASNSCTCTREDPWSQKHLGLAHNCRQGPWGTLPLATTGKPRTALRKPCCRERFPADLSKDWTLAPSSPERVLLTATRF